MKDKWPYLVLRRRYKRSMDIMHNNSKHTYWVVFSCLEEK